MAGSRAGGPEWGDLGGGTTHEKYCMLVVAVVVVWWCVYVVRWGGGLLGTEHIVCCFDQLMLHMSFGAIWYTGGYNGF